MYEAPCQGPWSSLSVLFQPLQVPSPAPSTPNTPISFTPKRTLVNAFPGSHLRILLPQLVCDHPNSKNSLFPGFHPLTAQTQAWADTGYSKHT